MANNWFSFKNFTIQQEHSAFKVGTDGVLLGAWADVSGVGSVLDIGTGTGLLALMIAQRTISERADVESTPDERAQYETIPGSALDEGAPVKITAIEIDKLSYGQAKNNVEESPWHERINVIHSSLQDFSPGRKFDLLISNPPFFQDSMTSADPGRTNSRHNTALSPEGLIKHSKPLLMPEGRLSLVFPVNESRLLTDICSEAGLSLHRRLGVKPTPSSAVKRYLMEFRLYPAESILEEEIIIEMGKRHEYSDQYRNLCRDFYLNF